MSFLVQEFKNYEIRKFVSQFVRFLFTSHVLKLMGYLSFSINFAAPKEHAKHDLHRATLCWTQLDERKRSQREESEF